MAQIVICKEESTKIQRFFRDNILIGTAKYTYGFSMDEIIIYQNGQLKYRFKETNHAIWFLEKCLPGVFLIFIFLLNWSPVFFFISLVLMLLSNRRYTIFEDNIKVGCTQDKWVSGMRHFIIHDNLYYMSIHKNEQFSLQKNGKQIALYSKEPIKILKSRPNTYHISYSDTEPIEIIELFCLIIDLFLFTNYGGTTILKVFVPHDPHPEYTQWRPKE